MVLQIAELTLLALLLSYLGTAGLRRWAERRHILDIPNERSSHCRPTPRGGGLAIVIVSLGGLLLGWLSIPVWRWSSLLAFISGAGLISVVSWLDDLHSLPNRVRFAAHSLGAGLAIVGFGYWHMVSLPNLGVLSLGWVGLPLTFLWIVGLTNAYNFMDGIDGIAGGQGMVAGLGWAVLGWQAGLPLVSLLGILLAACSLGFLGHNWPPARIFMGDVGSAFLGYTLAVMAVIAAQSKPRCVLGGILLVGPFVFDTIFTFLRRLKAGENVFMAHRSHLYQRLTLVGYSHCSISLMYIGLALFTTLLSILWVGEVDWFDPLLMITTVIVCVAWWRFVVWREYRHGLCIEGLPKDESSLWPVFWRFKKYL